MTYIVQNRASGVVVYAYTSDEAVDWPEYPFAEFNHIPQPVAGPMPTPKRRVTKLEFIGRIGVAFENILTAAKVDVRVELFVRMLDWATPEPDGTSVDLDDPRVVAALNDLEVAGLLASGHVAEILA